MIVMGRDEFAGSAGIKVFSFFWNFGLALAGSVAPRLATPGCDE